MPGLENCFHLDQRAVVNKHQAVHDATEGGKGGVRYGELGKEHRSHGESHDGSRWRERECDEEVDWDPCPRRKIEVQLSGPY
jgi:hypothetical protein